MRSGDWDPLADEPFSYIHTKDGRIRIAYRGRVVTTVAGAAATKLRSRLTAADAGTEQQLLARATGQFRHGNERGPSRP